MTKIIFIITGLGSGGAEQILYSMLKHIDKENLKPVVISMTTSGYWGEHIKELGITVISLRMKRSAIINGMIDLNKIIKKIEPDIIHAWMYDACLLSLLHKKFFKPDYRLILGLHHSLSKLNQESRKFKIVNWVCKILSMKADCIQYVSSKVRDEHEKYGYSSKNSVVIENGIDVNKFKPILLEQKNVLKKDKLFPLILSKETIVIGMFARYHPIKNHLLFFDIAEYLVQNYTEYDWAFVLCGMGCSEDNIKLKKLLKKKDIYNRFKLFGEVDTPIYYGLLDLLLCTSLAESFGLTIVEALASDVPVVSLDVGEASNILCSEGYGLIVSAGGSNLVKQFSRSCVRVISENWEDSNHTRREFVLQKYSIGKLANEYAELYEIEK